MYITESMPLKFKNSDYSYSQEMLIKSGLQFTSLIKILLRAIDRLLFLKLLIIYVYLYVKHIS